MTEQHDVLPTTQHDSEVTPLRIRRLPGDATVSLWREGYAFGTRRFERFDTQAFRTRILGRSTLMMRGVDAVRFFYGEDRFDRGGVVPGSVLHSLQDEGSVQTLAGDAHHARKEVLLDLAFAPRSRQPLVRVFRELLAEEMDRAVGRHDHDVLNWLTPILTATALTWVGLPYDERSLREHAVEFDAMIDGAGSFGVRNARGRSYRRRTERWARQIVDDVADERWNNMVVAHILTHTGDRDVAMVELLNIVRPVVAVARFAAFAALALWTHPEARAVAAESDAGARSVAQEVRRTAPFFPLIGGVATRELAWRGVRFSPGDRVIVDLFATNRDPRHWPAAGSFDARRFVDGRGEEDIVAQGAGSWSDGHRCPGEPATVDLLSAFVSELAGRRWEAPHQDLGVSLSRLPARAGRPGIRIRMLDGNR